MITTKSITTTTSTMVASTTACMTFTMETSTLSMTSTSMTTASTTRSSNVDSWWISTSTFTSPAIEAVVADEGEPRDSDAASGAETIEPEYAEIEADDYTEDERE